jgi:hypothetical protein
MPTSVTPASAETIALKGLGFLAESPDAMGRFLALSGLDPDSLKHRMGESDFLAAVTDFLLADDVLLKAFCDAESLDPRMMHLVRRALPGG